MEMENPPASSSANIYAAPFVPKEEGAPSIPQTEYFAICMVQIAKAAADEHSLQPVHYLAWSTLDKQRHAHVWNMLKCVLFPLHIMALLPIVLGPLI